MGPATQVTVLIVPGMGSNHCAGLVSTSLNRLNGVSDVTTQIADHEVTVTFDPQQLTDEDLRQAVEQAGYDVAQVRGMAGTQQLVLTVPGMGSNHCAGLVGKSLERLTGVSNIQPRVPDRQVLVSFDPQQVGADALRQAVEQAGYDVAQVSPVGEPDTADDDIEAAYLRAAKRKLILAAVPTTIIMVLMLVHMLWVEIPGYLLIVAVLAFPVVFVAGASTHRSAKRSLLNGTANMDVLISMGSLPPYLIGLVGFVYPITSFMEMAATIMTFHLLGRYLETLAKGQASQAIRALLTLGAKTARVLRNGEEVEVSVQDLAIGDVMVVRPGEKIPTDGEIVEGASHIDESLATGESVPVDKGPGEAVLGATLNQEGLLQIKATRVGSDTFLSQVIRLVKEAQGSQVPIQEFADQATAYFVPVVIGIAIVSLLSWWFFADTLRPVLNWGAGFLPWVDPTLNSWLLGILAAIAVLVIACPCALGLATPTALMVSSGMGAKRGVLIRSGDAIQVMKDIRTVVLDKTGTITQGKPALTNVQVIAPDLSRQQLLQAAASVEAGSEHPLGQAIVQGARAEGMEIPTVSQFQSFTARGVEGNVNGELVRVGSRRLLQEAGISPQPLEASLAELEAQGKTAMAVAIGDQAAGVIAVSDTVKADSKAAIASIKAQGITPVMVTGDNERTAQAIAKEVGIDRVLAGVLPEGKVDAIKHLQHKHGKVAMVGDGINDAPALTQADVGIAIGAGADVAIEAADVTLVQGELSKVTEVFQLSRATFRKIVQNLFWASIYNLLAIPIAALGLLHPMIGVVAMTASSLSVIGNSMLLKRLRFEE